MLSNMYSPVSKYSPEARKRMTYRSRQGKSCGYYMRIVFFFSSLIQTLIIIGLVLFVIYGKQQDSVDRVQDLELRFSQLSMETVSLRQQRQNLTHLLNVTAMERARDQFDLAKMRFTANISYIMLEDMDKKLRQCNFERASGRVNCPTEIRPSNPYYNPFPGSGCNCGSQMDTLRMKMELIQSNFTQTAMQMQLEIDQISRERDNLNLDVIQLRRDKSMLEKAIQFYQIKCKEEFVNSLSGISNVSKAFLTKIDSLFYSLSPFHLTCEKQKDYLEQIRINCTELSEEVVNKFQTYLDVLGDRVSMSQGNISVLTAENMRMTRDYNLCSQNRTGLIREHKQNVQRIQLKNDEEKETMLKERLKLKGQIEVLDNNVKFKDSQLDHVKEQLRHLNMSCITRSGGLFPRLGSQPGSTWNSQLGPSNPGFSNSNSGFSNSNSGFSNSNSGFSNSNSGFPNSNTGLNRNSFGSSSSSSSSSSLSSKFGSGGLNTGLGSSNSGLNKPSTTGLGSSSLGSNSGLGSSSTNKLGSNNQGSSSSFGFGSSGSSLNKQTSTGLGLGSSSSSSSSSSTFGSLFGSSNNPSSSTSNQNKFGSSGGTGSSSSSFGSSSSNQGSSSSSLGSNFGSSSNSGLGSSSSSSSSKPSTNSRGSSNSFFGSSSSSSSSSLGSSSSSQNKLSTSLNKGSSSSSSSSSSTGSSTTASKGFGGWGWLGGGSSNSNSNSNSNINSDQSKSLSNQGRGTSNTGSSFGSYGKPSTFSFTGPVSVSQHLRDLQRIINPSAPEEKQELSRMMG